MKRSVLLVVIIAMAIAAPAFSFDPSRHATARITVLQAPMYNRGEYEDGVAARVRHAIVRELRERGFDAVDGRMTLAEVERSGRADGGLYVEIAPSDAHSTPVGEVAVGGPHATVDVAVVVSRVAAELRVYDGRTLELIARRHLHRSSTSVVPTGIGAGTYRASVWFALPLVEYVRYRAAVNAVVEDAATEIAGIAR